MCDVDKFGSLEVYRLCVMMMSLEAWTFGTLHIVPDDDKFGTLRVYKFTCCV